MADNISGHTDAAITALNEDERMVTRHKRPDYFLLNDGLDDEASSEDRIPESDFESFIDLSSSDILPSESASQALTPVGPSSSIIARHSQKRTRPAPLTNWMWAHFEVTEVAREWVIKRTRRRESTDRDIRCVYIDNNSGIQCPWKTSDSLRHVEKGISQ
ncbi:hypothetical protein V1527DRAFT_516050 [Lipomyces starkeyi]